MSKTETSEELRSDTSKNSVFREEKDSFLGLPAAEAGQSTSSVVYAAPPTEADPNLVTDDSQSIVRQAGFHQTVIDDEFAHPLPTSPVYSEFIVVRNPWLFSQKEYIVRVLWLELAGIGKQLTTLIPIGFGENRLSTSRRFVVLGKENFHFVRGCHGKSSERRGTLPEQRDTISTGEDVSGSSKSRLGGRRMVTVLGTPAKFLPRFHRWTSNFLIFLFFLGEVDAAPQYHYAYNATTSSSLPLVTKAIRGALYSSLTASVIGITEVSIKKRIQRGQSTLFTYFIAALAMLLLSFALMDDLLDANERFLLAIFLTALGVWLLGSLLRTIMRRRDTCSLCKGVGCDECGGGSSSGGEA